MNRGRIHAPIFLALLFATAILAGCAGWFGKGTQKPHTSQGKTEDTTTADSLGDAGHLDSVHVALTDSTREDSLDTSDSLAVDSTLADSLAMDSTLTDSLEADSLAERPQDEDQVDTTITYSAENIRFDVPRRTTILTGRAKVKYKQSTLEANEIIVDWDNNMMLASEGYDTLWTDTTETEIDTIIVKGLPTFSDQGQVMTGSNMKLNMKNKQGYVVKGRTKDQVGYYGGDELQKITDDVFFVHDGYFTSCEEDPPHYRFTSNKMKMVRGDKVVAEPIVLRFGDVPVFALPFGVFSIQSGRRSGILIPTYGDDRSKGRNLRGFGYYYAGSEYWDAKMIMDFYEKAGTFHRYDINYKKRYVLDGRINGSYSNQSGSRGDFDVAWSHNQDIDPTLKIRINGKYVSSGGYYNNTSYNTNQIVNKNVNSDATITKSFTNGVNTTINLSHKQNLLTDANSQELPVISIRVPTITLFPGEDEKKDKDPNVIYRRPEERIEVEMDEEDEVDPWYRNITLNYSANMKNLRKVTREGMTNNDPTTGTLHEEYTSGIRQTVSINSPLKVMKYITVNPNATIYADLLNERRDYSLTIGGSLQNIQERGVYGRAIGSAGLNTSTKLYGYFNINRWSVKTIRHVVTPSVNFTFRPDYSDPEWNYYTYLYDSTDTESSYDKYAGSAYSGTPRGRQMALRFSLDNLFQMKRGVLNKEGEEEEVKKDLFNLNFSTSVNMAADSMKWSNFSTSFRVIENLAQAGPLKRLTFDMSATHSFYQIGEWEENGTIRRRQINKFYWDRPNAGINLLRLTNLSANVGYSMSGGSPFVVSSAPTRQDREAEQDSLDFENGEGPPPVDSQSDRFDDPMLDRARRAAGGKDPWTISGGLRYNLSMTDPMYPSESLRLSANMTLNLTQNWAFSYSTSMDLLDRSITLGSIAVTRDLHCWQGTLQWSPFGFRPGFYLVIGLKSSMLRDVKFEQRGGQGGSGSISGSYY